MYGLANGAKNKDPPPPIGAAVIVLVSGNLSGSLLTAVCPYLRVYLTRLRGTTRTVFAEAKECS